MKLKILHAEQEWRIIMKTVKGIYAEAKIFTDDVETYAQAQVKMICDNEVADGSTICMMPDIHPGKVAPIGLSMTVTDKVIPQLLGVNIGCGMTCVRLNKNNAEFQKLDKVIRENVPSGFTIRKEPHHMAEKFSYEGLHCIRHINQDKADSYGILASEYGFNCDEWHYYLWDEKESKQSKNEKNKENVLV